MASISKQKVLVDVIIPVHNASETIENTTRSAMNQIIPLHLIEKFKDYSLSVAICCYDDGSVDDSWSILKKLEQEFSDETKGHEYDTGKITTELFLGQSSNGIGRGAGFARNRAVELSNSRKTTEDDSGLHFLCLLDSDDTMHPHRVAEQASHMLGLPLKERRRTLLGCQFDRDPPDSTWHYSSWANNLSDTRLMLERFREVTVLQPTWFVTKSRFLGIGPYVEAPPPGSAQDVVEEFLAKEATDLNRLVHPNFDTLQSLRLAEDLRFFHDHLLSNGLVRIHRTGSPMVTYRHTGTSQSFRTSRKLLLQLRVLAFERSILNSDTGWHEDDGKFIIWGAGRDGKDFVKALTPNLRARIYNFVDVDEKKLASGNYVNRDLNVSIPIVHFSFLMKDRSQAALLQAEWEAGSDMGEGTGSVTKSKPMGDLARDGSSVNGAKVIDRAKRCRHQSRPALEIRGLDQDKLSRLPVVVCVAMYRTNGVLEKNVELIGRQEGHDLWHFS